MGQWSIETADMQDPASQDISPVYILREDETVVAVCYERAQADRVVAALRLSQTLVRPARPDVPLSFDPDDYPLY